MLGWMLLALASGPPISCIISVRGLHRHGASLGLTFPRLGPGHESDQTGEFLAHHVDRWRRQHGRVLAETHAIDTLTDTSLPGRPRCLTNAWRAASMALYWGSFLFRFFMDERHGEFTAANLCSKCGHPSGYNPVDDEHALCVCRRGKLFVYQHVALEC